MSSEQLAMSISKIYHAETQRRRDAEMSNQRFARRREDKSKNSTINLSYKGAARKSKCILKQPRNLCASAPLREPLLLTILLTALIFVFIGCGKTPAEQSGAVLRFASYLDIPGVTAEEITAIEAVKSQTDYFVYGMMPGVESFLCLDGEIRGYAAHIAEWFSELFEIPFILKFYTWNGLLDGLSSGEIDFTSDLNISEERRKIYFMTDAISQHPLMYFRLFNSRPLSEIRRIRLPRYVFLDGTTTINNIKLYAAEPYESVIASGYDDAYQILKTGRGDAIVIESVTEAFFDVYGDITTSTFLPLIYSQVAFTTQNPKLAPFISVVQKALENGALRYLNELFMLGDQEYRRHKFSIRLTEEEREYIKNNPVIPFVADFDNYPANFYNERDKEWQGIAFDVLREIEILTGFNFEIINDEKTEFPDALRKLETGEALIQSDLIRSREREGRFLWPDSEFIIDRPALISKTEFPNLRVNEVLSARVGISRASAYAELFRIWFPNHNNTVEFESQGEAFDALIRGEIDMVMNTYSGLLHLTNYMELPGFKANIVFDHVFESNFGINLNEPVLRSIICKVLPVIDTRSITEQWNRKTFDYRVKLEQEKSAAQRPWMITGIGLALSALTLLSILLLKNHNEGKRLDRLVRMRTNELEHQTIMLKEMEEEARAANLSKSAFLANMSHEMRTPMNVVVGLTELMLEEDTPPADFKENMGKINTAGSTLLGLINDILDISKIEAGKLELAPVLYETPSIINDIVVLNVIRIQEKPITFKLDINDNLPLKLCGDDLRVKQVINNILSNAFKYTHSGIVTLGLSCERDGDNVWLSMYVSDTGIGIREENLQKLFMDYYQVDAHSNRSTEGTGLGLAITRRLVELMGGEITAQSEYGKGSVFSVCIKQGYVCDSVIGKEIAESLRTFSYTEKKKTSANKLARPDLSFAKVLVVDDMPTNLDVAAGILRKYKMQVDCVMNGYDAVEKIRVGEPVYDAVFMDHMMPGMDGIEAAQSIRALGTDYAKHIPIIALTANAVQGTAELFLKNGFQVFLSKPVNIKELDSIIQKWISKKQEKGAYED